MSVLPDSSVVSDSGVVSDPAVPPTTEAERQALVQRLAQESHAFDGSGCDPERNCWLVVHRHVHGVLPSEYDIREIDEELYIAVLNCRLQSQSGI
jgi:hypothetical protein